MNWVHRYIDTLPLNAWRENRARMEHLWRDLITDHPVVTVRYPLPEGVPIFEGVLGPVEKDFAQQVRDGLSVDADAVIQGFDNVPVLSPMAPASGAGTHLLAAIMGAPITAPQEGNSNWSAWSSVLGLGRFRLL